jgi:hypothetical protein
MVDDSGAYDSGATRARLFVLVEPDRFVEPLDDAIDRAVEEAGLNLVRWSRVSATVAERPRRCFSSTSWATTASASATEQNEPS